MPMLPFSELWSRLCNGDESVLIEAKRGTEAGKSIFETISAFSNEPDAGGGYFLFGVATKSGSLFPDYEVQGVSDPDKLQSDIATQCREVFSCSIRPQLAVETIGDKTVVVAFIAEANPHDKPVFVKSRGVDKGAFRRIGPTDHLCTEDDLALFFQSRGHKSYDENVIDGTSFDDIDPRAVTEYRNLRGKAVDGSTSELLRYDDADLLYALSATSQSGANAKLTLAGLVLFGKLSAIRRHLPMTRVDYIRVDGREWVPDPDKRYQSIERLGPLILVIPQLIGQVLDDIPKAFTLPENDVHRRDVPLIPKKVIREAIVNCLMHRSYRSHQPVQIIRYANRIEIRNPGYSLIPDERLGEPGSKTRNPKIAAVLHDVGLAETKGTGIRVMREAMETANLTQPLIESDRVRDEFTLRLLVHHLLGQEDIKWLAKFKDCNLSSEEARALIIVREMQAIDNASYRSINHVDALTASSRLRRMRDLGLLERHGKSSTTYYTAGPKLLGAVGKRPPKTSVSADALRRELEPGLRRELEDLRRELTDELRADLDNLPKRASPEVLNDLIQRLCNCRPFSLAQLSLLLAKHPDHLQSRNIKRMLLDKRLLYLHPAEINHPRQMYVAGEFV